MGTKKRCMNDKKKTDDGQSIDTRFGWCQRDFSVWHNQEFQSWETMHATQVMTSNSFLGLGNSEDLLTFLLETCSNLNQINRFCSKQIIEKLKWWLNLNLAFHLSALLHPNLQSKWILNKYFSDLTLELNNQFGKQDQTFACMEYLYQVFKKYMLLLLMTSNYMISHENMLLDNDQYYRISIQNYTPVFVQDL